MDTFVKKIVTSTQGLDEGLIYEYTAAANPLQSGTISAVPYADFPASLHEKGRTGVIALDLSEKLNRRGPATSPGLCANFVRNKSIS